MNKKIVFLFFLVSLLIVPLVGLAQSPDPATWFKDIIIRFINIIVWPALVGFTIIMIVYAGMLFIGSSGDPSKIDKAKKALIWAIVGVFIGVLAFSAQKLINDLLFGAPAPAQACGDTFPQCNGTCPAGQMCSEDPVEEECICT